MAVSASAVAIGIGYVLDGVEAKAEHGGRLVAGRWGTMRVRLRDCQ